MTWRKEPLTGYSATISNAAILAVAERAWDEVAHHDIKTSEILTCYQIGLDRQSHYAHKDVTAEVAVVSPDPSQL